MLSVCGSFLRPAQVTNSAWMGMRSLFYFAGLLVSGYFINYMTGVGSGNERHFDGLRWNHFVPMIFCIFGLFHTAVIRSTRPTISDYSPHEEADDMVFKDNENR